MGIEFLKIIASSIMPTGEQRNDTDLPFGERSKGCLVLIASAKAAAKASLEICMRQFSSAVSESLNRSRRRKTGRVIGQLYVSPPWYDIRDPEKSLRVDCVDS